MTSKVYVVTDLGPGDGGKGSVVHKIATMRRAHTVIKRGGAQGSHSVCTSRGEKFAFSQWGCGTLSGIPTHISGQMIVAPEGLLNEATALRYSLGVDDPFRLLTVDETAVCATPLHSVASRLKELARGGSPRGTVGTGAGEAYRNLQRRPDLALHVKDLTRPDLPTKLVAIRNDIQKTLIPVIEGEFLPQDDALVAEELELLADNAFLDYVTQRFQEVGEVLKIVPSDYLGEVIIPKAGVAVVESSHGVLTDRERGFHPHTSAIRTLPCFTRDMLEDAGFTEQIVNIGVTRAYAIRHGAGPMPTANPEMTARLLPDSSKDENRYQGKVRVGPIDMVLLRYALQACGGPAKFDGLAITCVDQLKATRGWEMCHSYTGELEPRLFDASGDIRIVDEPTETYQAELGAYLAACQPVLSTVPLSTKVSREDLFSLVATVLNDLLDVPVRMVSFGPTEEDKFCK